ncbi:MAG: TetR/AcrR family transcriptional regulator [Alphaproteobacteria bacterium]|nr:TetR/AcrR family transcriptional regulator [Alphaproteobacteria bacterium]
MARKRSGKSHSSDPRGALLAAALAAAEDGRWQAVTLRTLSEAAGVPFGQAYALFQSPGDVAAAVLNDAVIASMAEALPDASLSPKDRIFDAAMNVFDHLKDRRSGLGGLLAAYRWRPVAGAAFWRSLGRFARVSLERAGVGADGAAGAARIAALTRTLALVLAVFAEDDDGLSRTMAALDTRLHEAERWAKRLGWGRASEAA